MWKSRAGHRVRKGAGGEGLGFRGERRGRGRGREERRCVSMVF